MSIKEGAIDAWNNWG
ncbi:hypothetical protein, partial [Candidatus Kuenenia stuttgartiensis]